MNANAENGVVSPVAKVTGSFEPSDVDGRNTNRVLSKGTMQSLIQAVAPATGFIIW